MAPRIPHILLVLRPPIECYPPSINQANILVEQGFRVSAVQEFELSRSSIDVGLNSKVRRYFINDQYKSQVFLRRIARVIRFRHGVRLIVKKLHPDVVLAYDAEVSYLLGDSPARSGARLIWHFHEVPEDQITGWTVKFANRYVWQNARKPDLIIFPDPGRAEVFAGKTGLEQSTISIVANCPRSVTAPPRPTLHKSLADHMPQYAPVVLYHGSVGQDHGLETAIRSMPKWPKDAFFVAKGRMRNDYATHLRALAKSVRVAHRLILVDPGFQSLEDHYSFVAGADVGWTVLEPVSNAWRYSALASNKRFECMALGVPQISDNGPILPELIERNGCGLCIPHDSVDAAADAVNRLLYHCELRRQMSTHARELHLTEYNYDNQFNSVLDLLGKMIQQKNGY